MDNRMEYKSPLSSRYASKEMKYIFSEQKKFTTWHELWIALAKAEQKLGLNITDDQINEMVAAKDIVDYDVAEEREKHVRHDVMSHVYAYGKRCPKAEPIIHLGATSCYVGDNTDVILMRDALDIIIAKAVQVLMNLSSFAIKYKELPCLGYTHLQPAQLTTVGKRTTLWMYDLALDIIDLERRRDDLRMLGSKGTTGSQASFMELFNDDEEKVRQLDKLIAEEFGFSGCVPVSGQTYSRKFDYNILSTLCGVAQSASKFSNDMRLLQSFGEMEEPFEANQIGSSAMPYKRNPMRSERITSLARYVMIDSLNPAITAATQWFERTLDDSANKRISVPEAFLAIDGIMELYINISADMVVYPRVIYQRTMEKLPFIATENIMMEAVKKGGNRQELHEKLRVYSREATLRVKKQGLENNLLDLIAADPEFRLDKNELMAVMDPRLYTGRSASQVDDFIEEIIKPIILRNPQESITAEINL